MENGKVESSTGMKGDAADRSIGFIGCGVMGEAILSALVTKGIFAPSRVFVSDVRADQAERVASSLGVTSLRTNREVVRSASIVVMAVKPQVFAEVIQEVSGSLTPGHLLVSVAAGIDTRFIEGQIREGVAVVRVMPNTPAAIGMGMSAICAGTRATEEDVSIVKTIMSSLGEVVVVKEKDMDAVTGLSGSGPAYCFMFIESLAEAGVLAGLTRDVALKLACQTVLGSAAMVMSTGEHPAVLRSRVTSPGGTTAAALRVLERDGFRSAVLEAVTAATARSRELSGRT